MIMEHFGFDKVHFATATSAFVAAYTLMQIPGGMLAERYGIRIVGALALVCWSLFTFLTPMAGGFYSFLLIRFLFGLGEGPLFPNNGAFLTRWFSTREKALSSSIMLSGAFIGPAIGPPLTVWIIEHWGWQAVFYLFGAAGFILAPVWYFFSREYPHQHPKVNDAEVAIIEGLAVRTVKAPGKTARIMPPWKSFLRSSQFWCFGLQYFIVTYVLYLFLTWIPMYLLEARGMSMSGMGFAASAPWLVSCVAVVISGKISDSLVARGKSKFMSRSVMAMLGLFFCGIFMYLAARASTPEVTVLWLSLTFGTLGFSFTSSWTACQDLGLHCAGSVVAWMQTWANLAGVCAPVITALLVERYGWETTLVINSMQSFVGVLLWLMVRPDKPLVAKLQS